uniref:Tubulin-specific chaperone A n=1 Tax=Noctiluca scintillans TaxID=2966 RepID=A0A6T8WEC2_NOCSC|mmetsp:Transcript_26645/g.69970  ORF Transcript_26645/g.69970 Transcript_26645/m.69970 type:complete len:145 (+) Transcript_26645:77-511(+)
MWFLFFVASMQILPTMTMRMSSNQTKLLQEVSAEQQDSPEQAVENAQKRHSALLQRAEEAKTRGTDEPISDAQQKLLNAREHFAAVNASFSEQMYVADLAQKLYVALPAEDSEILESARREVTAAQKSLDEAAALVRQLETQNA